MVNKEKKSANLGIKVKPSITNRVKTGIPGLDNMIQGGFVRGSANLVSGSCGTGKTLFGAQFLYYGARDHGENGVLISLEETPEDIRGDMKNLGLDPTQLEKQGKLTFKYINPVQFVDTGRVVESSVLSSLKEAVEKTGAKRVVLDSIGAFELYIEQAHLIRKKIYAITRALKDMGVTSILTTETHDYSNLYSRYGVEEFVCDSVILLSYTRSASGTNMRSLFIRKIRRTGQSDEIHPFGIERGIGLKILPVSGRFHKYLLTKSYENVTSTRPSH